MGFRFFSISSGLVMMIYAPWRKIRMALLGLLVICAVVSCGGSDDDSNHEGTGGGLADDDTADDDVVDDDAIDNDDIDDDSVDDDATDDDSLDDDTVDDDTVDDDTVDDDIIDDDTVDDDTVDDDTVDDDTVDDDTVDDDIIDDDTVDDDTVDDDTVDDDTVDDDTVVESDYIAIGAAAVADTVAPLLDWREAQGMTAWFMDTETIAANWPGEDLPAQIRAYLQNVYAPTRLQYLLLVGSQEALPMRWVDPDPLVPGEYACLTDYYYADLDGDFDADGDGIYGEYGEDIYDWHPELMVGRWPIDDLEELALIADKTLQFGQNNPDYKWDVLLAAGSIEFEGDSAIIMQMINNKVVEPNGYASYRLYEFPGLIQPDAWLTHDAFVGQWSGTPYGLAMWASHGSDSCAFAGDPFVCDTDTPQFSDGEPAMTFSSACSNGDISAPDCLGTSLLMHGGVSFVGSTAITHPGVIGEASLIFLTMMYQTLVENAPLAAGVDISKEQYMDIYFPLQWYDDGLYLRNFFGFNLLGDPALTYWTAR